MRPKKAAIIQPNYIPWKGYFDIINMVDEFILFDDVQYTQRDWRNRNVIKTPQGLQWLTIPVQVKGKYFQKIKETMVSEKNWGKKHWNAIAHNYAGAKHFKDYRTVFEELYRDTSREYLCEIDYAFLTAVNEILGITTKISWSSSYETVEGQNERLISLCKRVGAAEYISGPAARDYMDEELFANENIRITWFDYSGYPEYTQLYPPFEHRVSIIDLIFNEGPRATEYMKTFGRSS